MYKTYSTAGILWILALGGTLQGLETSSMAVFIGSDQFKSFFNDLAVMEQGIISGANPLGAFVGCWLVSFISDRFGRVSAMQSGAILWIFGSIVSIVVQNLYMLIGGRAIKGIAVGMFSSILPVYVSEVIHVSKRGLATSIMQWCLTWGILLMFYLSYFCSFIDGPGSFRIAWGIETAPGGIFLLLSFMLPESPKWYAAKSRWEDASITMKKLNKETTKANIKKVEAMPQKPQQVSNLKDIEEVLDSFENDSKKCTYSDLFRRNLRPHLLIGITTQMITQLSGIGVLMYYLIFICEMIGLTGQVKVLSASIQYVVNVLFTIFPILWLDKLRRKDVMTYGACCLGFSIGAIGIVMEYYGHSVPPINGNESAVWEVTGTPGSFCLALCFLFVAIFASTLSCAAWLYTNEIFPARAKSKGSAICMSVSWILNFALTFLAPLSLKHLKWGTFCMFSGFCIIGAIVMAFLFPETSDLTDQQVSDLFRKYRTDSIELEDQKIGSKTVLDNEEDANDDQQRSMKSLTKGSQIPSLRVPSVSGRSSSLKSKDTISEKSPVSPLKKDRDSFLRSSSLRSTFKQDQGVSPFLIKNMGGPFDSGSELKDLNSHLSKANTASEHYYNNMGINETPLLNFYKDSPFSRENNE